MYSSKRSTTELWAVLSKDGRVMYSRGGSSTQPKLMVYPSRSSAERALKSSWIKQVIPDRSAVRVQCIYVTPAPASRRVEKKEDASTI
jgi:hypothetical protein